MNKLLVILFILGIILISGCINTKKADSRFLYQSEKEHIPAVYLLYDHYPVSENLNTDLLYGKEDKIYCKGSDKEAEKVEYYRIGGIGGWTSRYAIICNNNYWIADGSYTFGERLYGSFNLEGVYQTQGYDVEITNTTLSNERGIVSKLSRYEATDQDCPYSFQFYSEKVPLEGCKNINISEGSSVILNGVLQVKTYKQCLIDPCKLVTPQTLKSIIVENMQTIESQPIDTVLSSQACSTECVSKGYSSGQCKEEPNVPPFKKPCIEGEISIGLQNCTNSFEGVTIDCCCS